MGGLVSAARRKHNEAIAHWADPIGPKQRRVRAQDVAIADSTQRVLAALEGGDDTALALAYTAAVHYVGLCRDKPRRGKPTEEDWERAVLEVRAMVDSTDPDARAAFLGYVRGGLYLEAVMVWDGGGRQAKVALADA